MQHGIVAGTIPHALPFAGVIQAAADAAGFSAALAYGVAWRETIRGQKYGQWNAATVVSTDGGHGLFQLTSSYPDDWREPESNARYALDNFLKPARDFFVAKGVLGEALVRCIAAAFNAGTETAWEAHLRYDVDSVTTGHNYGADVFRVYHAIINRQSFT